MNNKSGCHWVKLSVFNEPTCSHSMSKVLDLRIEQSRINVISIERLS